MSRVLGHEQVPPFSTRLCAALCAGQAAGGGRLAGKAARVWGGGAHRPLPGLLRGKVAPRDPPPSSRRWQPRAGLPGAGPAAWANWEGDCRRLPPAPVHLSPSAAGRGTLWLRDPRVQPRPGRDSASGSPGRRAGRAPRLAEKSQRLQRTPFRRRSRRPGPCPRHPCPPRGPTLPPAPASSSSAGSGQGRRAADKHRWAQPGPRALSHGGAHSEPEGPGADRGEVPETPRETRVPAPLLPPRQTLRGRCSRL